MVNENKLKKQSKLNMNNKKNKTEEEKGEENSPETAAVPLQRVEQGKGPM